jgi:hypothetical protein
MKLLVESEKGHDEIEVPNGEEQKAVEGQLKDGKWVTLEKEDGNTEILTESDIPEEEMDEEDKELMKANEEWKGAFKKEITPAVKHPAKATAPVSKEEWKNKFGSVETATATQKAKGG